MTKNLKMGIEKFELGDDVAFVEHRDPERDNLDTVETSDLQSSQFWIKC